MYINYSRRNIRVTLKLEEREVTFEVEPYRQISYLKEKAYEFFYPLHHKIRLLYNNKDLTAYEDYPLTDYFKNKVSIFCSSLKKGDYTFTVSLLPRYTGSYHLNPAKAELMYFPVLYGREGMKRVKVE